QVGGDQARRPAVWPKGTRSLSGHLKRLAPNLREAGWVVTRGERTSKKRPWIIHRLGHANGFASQPSHQPSSDAPCNAMQGDADWYVLPPRDANDGNDANAG